MTPGAFGGNIVPPMATTVKSKFGVAVFAKLAANHEEGRKPDSIRGLARLIGNGDEVRTATLRRSLNKWCADGRPYPSKENRDLVAHHLEIDASELEDEEDRAMTLDEFLQSRIDVAVEKMLAKRLASA